MLGVKIIDGLGRMRLSWIAILAKFLCMLIWQDLTRKSRNVTIKDEDVILKHVCFPLEQTYEKTWCVRP